MKRFLGTLALSIIAITAITFAVERGKKEKADKQFAEVTKTNNDLRTLRNYTTEDIRLILGTPLSVAKDNAGGQRWIYSKWTVVFMESGRVLGICESDNAPDNTAASDGREPSAARGHRPGRYVITHNAAGQTQVTAIDPGISYLQSIGLNAGGGPTATPIPSASDTRRAELGLTGTALDKRPTR